MSWTRLCLFALAGSLLVILGCGGGGGSTPPTPTIQPPGALSYTTSTAVYTMGIAITPNAPSSTGGAVISYSINPPTPEGMNLSATTGILSGTPTAVIATASYTVTASNLAGSTTVNLTITVNELGPWVQTGNLAVARAGHTATLLQNGKVLVSGDYGGNARFLSSCEIYDPSTGTWSPTGSMAIARGGHTATLLPNGKVIVVGGETATMVVTSSSEIFDPSTGTWTTSGSMAASRSGHTSTLLPNGKVLVAGGKQPSANLLAIVPIASCEIFDPLTGAWGPTGSLVTEHANHTATRLSDGRVLVIAGIGGHGVIRSVEIYDPAIGAWSLTVPLGTGAEGFTTASILSSGRVLATGGFSYASYPLPYAEVFDVNSGAWAPTPNMATARAYHTATLLQSGKVLVVGGSGPLGVLSLAEIYDPSLGSWSVAPAMGTARRSHTATLLLNGKLLVAGGFGSSGALVSTELL